MGEQAVAQAEDTRCLVETSPALDTFSSPYTAEFLGAGNQAVTRAAQTSTPARNGGSDGLAAAFFTPTPSEPAGRPRPATTSAAEQEFDAEEFFAGFLEALPLDVTVAGVVCVLTVLGGSTVGAGLLGLGVLVAGYVEYQSFEADLGSDWTVGEWAMFLLSVINRVTGAAPAAEALTGERITGSSLTSRERGAAMAHAFVAALTLGLALRFSGRPAARSDALDRPGQGLSRPRRVVTTESYAVAEWEIVDPTIPAPAAGMALPESRPPQLPPGPPAPHQLPPGPPAPHQLPPGPPPPKQLRPATEPLEFEPLDPADPAPVTEEGWATLSDEELSAYPGLKVDLPQRPPIRDEAPGPGGGGARMMSAEVTSGGETYLAHYLPRSPAAPGRAGEEWTVLVSSRVNSTLTRHAEAILRDGVLTITLVYLVNDGVKIIAGIRPEVVDVMGRALVEAAERIGDVAGIDVSPDLSRRLKIEERARLEAENARPKLPGLGDPAPVAPSEADLAVLVADAERLRESLRALFPDGGTISAKDLASLARGDSSPIAMDDAQALRQIVAVLVEDQLLARPASPRPDRYQVLPSRAPSTDPASASSPGSPGVPGPATDAPQVLSFTDADVLGLGPRIYTVRDLGRFYGIHPDDVPKLAASQSLLSFGNVYLPRAVLHDLVSALHELPPGVRVGRDALTELAGRRMTQPWSVEHTAGLQFLIATLRHVGILAPTGDGDFLVVIDGPDSAPPASGGLAERVVAEGLQTFTLQEVHAAFREAGLLLNEASLRLLIERGDLIRVSDERFVAGPTLGLLRTVLVEEFAGRHVTVDLLVRTASGRGIPVWPDDLPALLGVLVERGELRLHEDGTYQVPAATPAADPAAAAAPAPDPAPRSELASESGPDSEPDLLVLMATSKAILMLRSAFPDGGIVVRDDLRNLILTTGVPETMVEEILPDILRQLVRVGELQPAGPGSYLMGPTAADPPPATEPVVTEVPDDRTAKILIGELMMDVASVGPVLLEPGSRYVRPYQPYLRWLEQEGHLVPVPGRPDTYVSREAVDSVLEVVRQGFGGRTASLTELSAYVADHLPDPVGDGRDAVREILDLLAAAGRITRAPGDGEPTYTIPGDAP